MLKLFPSDALEKLEYDKVIEACLSYCYGEPGKQSLLSAGISDNYHEIRMWMEEQEAFALLDSDLLQLPMSYYEAINEEMKLLPVKGTLLPIESFLRIKALLKILKSIMDFFSEKERGHRYPALSVIVKDVIFPKDIFAAISSILDDEGNVANDASPELWRIFRQISRVEKQVEVQFNQVLRQYRGRDTLLENQESVRNGRRVLAVKAEHKRAVKGIIHDLSASGKSAFIEPEACIPLNNEIQSLHYEKQREIQKILLQLTDKLRPHQDELPIILDLVTRYDDIQAKYRFSKQIGGKVPAISPHPFLDIIEAQHPLLRKKNDPLGLKTIPFSVKLSKFNRLLLVSGPNAGGKSILLKAVGLLQLMVQSGFMIPCDERSNFGVFSSFFADIGDQQSLEEDLSTYSSRLMNMKFFLENANDGTLVCIDEFGSGTDPKLGGAIAQSVLQELVNSNCMGVITTHYGNLKIFAYKAKGVLNAAMAFDNKKLRPTFRLQVGQPGSSYAFELARMAGIPPKILKQAERFGGTKLKNVDELLISLEEEQQTAQDLRIKLEKQANMYDSLIKQYEKLFKDLELRKKRIKQEEKERALQSTDDERRALEKLVKELATNKKIEKAKALAEKKKKEKARIEQQLSEINDDLYQGDFLTLKKEDAKPGTFVKVKHSGATGVIESVDRKNVFIQVGQIRMKVPLKDLAPANAPLQVNARKSVTTEISENRDFGMELDIRGYRIENAAKLLQQHIENAMIANLSMLKILHGKGQGILRKMVWEVAKKYDAVDEIYHAEDNDGGIGVTMIILSS